MKTTAYGDMLLRLKEQRERNRLNAGAPTGIVRKADMKRMKIRAGRPAHAQWSRTEELKFQLHVRAMKVLP